MKRKKEQSSSDFFHLFADFVTAFSSVIMGKRVRDSLYMLFFFLHPPSLFLKVKKRRQEMKIVAIVEDAPSADTHLNAS